MPREVIFSLHDEALRRRRRGERIIDGTEASSSMMVLAFADPVTAPRSAAAAVARGWQHAAAATGENQHDMTRNLQRLETESTQGTIGRARSSALPFRRLAVLGRSRAALSSLQSKCLPTRARAVGR